jgi:hypothetical protein
LDEKENIILNYIDELKIKNNFINDNKIKMIEIQNNYDN